MIWFPNNEFYQSNFDQTEDFGFSNIMPNTEFNSPILMPYYTNNYYKSYFEQSELTTEAQLMPLVFIEDISNMNPLEYLQ